MATDRVTVGEFASQFLAEKTASPEERATLLFFVEGSEAIERAIERVHEARWASADLLLVSDGEFGCVPAMAVPLTVA